MRTLLRYGAEGCFFLRLAATTRCGGPWSTGLAVWSVTVSMKLAAVLCCAGVDASAVVVVFCLRLTYTQLGRNLLFRGSRLWGTP